MYIFGTLRTLGWGVYPSAGKLEISTEPLPRSNQFSKAGYNLEGVPFHAHSDQGELDVDGNFRGLSRFFVVEDFMSVIQVKLPSFLDRTWNR